MSFSDVYSTVMKARRVIALVGIVAGAGYKAVPMVWHKSEAKPATVAASTLGVPNTTNAANGIVVKGPIYSFGEVTLTNHYETSVKLGEGKNCMLVPKVLGNQMELTLSVETRNATGKTTDLAVRQVTAKAGKPVEISLGGVQLAFTPMLAKD